MKLLLLLPYLFVAFPVNAQSSFGTRFPVNSGYYTSFDSTKIYYEVSGKGKPVLLVHGFIVNSNSWKNAAIYKDLLKDGYKVILLDMRGNGQSDKPHNEEAYAHDAEAKDITGLMTYLKIKKYSVVGYSRGSIITARLLLRDKRIANAVIGGMGTQFTDPQWPRRLMFYHALIGDSVPELKGMVKYVQQQRLDQLALAYLQKYQPSATKKELRSIRQPVLIIRGEKDMYNTSAPELAKIFPHSTYTTVPGDHDHAASTAVFSEKVRNFFKKQHY